MYGKTFDWIDSTIRTKLKELHDNPVRNSINCELNLFAIQSRLSDLVVYVNP